MSSSSNPLRSSISFLIANTFLFTSSIVTVSIQEVKKTSIYLRLAKPYLRRRALLCCNPRQKQSAGAILKRRYQGFCGAEQVYFVDEDIKNRVLNNPPFARLPLVVDSLTSNTGNNMYIVKKGKILDQVNIGDLNIGYPDYLCYTSEFGVIDVLLRGTGRGTNIMPKNPGFSCGPMPVEPDFREQEEIAGEVVTRQVNSAENPILQDIRTATVFQTDSGGSLQIG